MSGERKPDLEEYAAWLRKEIGAELDDRASRLFNINAIAARDTCQNHAFFASLEATLGAISEEYERATGARLFSHLPGTSGVKLVTKSYESALNKSYRQNVVLNNRFPKPPTDAGWLLPEGWFRAFDDIVRTQLICRYLDGPKFVAERLDGAAKKARLESQYSSVQHDRGYYAYHFYVKIPADLIDGKTLVTVEIQLTTQLQDVVYDLTHGFYEELRVQERAAQRGDGWKWEYKTARFKAGYLSHTLHLLEGLIAEVRGERIAPPVGEEQYDRPAKPEAADAAGAVPPGDPEKGPGGGT